MGCMDLMKDYDDNHFDLAIIDPNYGIGASKPSKKTGKVKQKNGTTLLAPLPNYTPKDWDDKPVDPKILKEIFRVSKNQIIWGCNYYDYDLRGGRIVWDKLNGDSDQFGCEIAYQSFNNRTDIVRFMWAGMFQGVYCGTDAKKAIVQQGNKALNEKRVHVTQKPVALYDYLLNKYAKPGDSILDTHLGSGSLAISCNKLGFDLTASEIDKEIYNDAWHRFKLETAQLKLKLL